MPKSKAPKMKPSELQILLLADELAHMLHAQEFEQALSITHSMQTHLARIEQKLYATLPKDA